MRYVMGDSTVIVPDHRELTRSTLSHCMRKAGVSRDELPRKGKKSRKSPVADS